MAWWGSGGYEWRGGGVGGMSGVVGEWGYEWCGGGVGGMSGVVGEWGV